MVMHVYMYLYMGVCVYVYSITTSPLLFCPNLNLSVIWP